MFHLTWSKLFTNFSIHWKFRTISFLIQQKTNFFPSFQNCQHSENCYSHNITLNISGCEMAPPRFFCFPYCEPHNRGLRYIPEHPLSGRPSTMALLPQFSHNHLWPTPFIEVTWPSCQVTFNHSTSFGVTDFFSLSPKTTSTKKRESSVAPGSAISPLPYSQAPSGHSLSDCLITSSQAPVNPTLQDRSILLPKVSGRP